MANPGLGYVLLWRDVVEGPLWNNGKPFSEGQAWIQFILWAEFQEDTQFINNQMVTLKPGEFAFFPWDMEANLNVDASAAADDALEVIVFVRTGTA